MFMSFSLFFSFVFSAIRTFLTHLSLFFDSQAAGKVAIDNDLGDGMTTLADDIQRGRYGNTPFLQSTRSVVSTDFGQSGHLLLLSCLLPLPFL